MTIPFTLLGGYLGAGKTTLLNHLLANNTGERLALLINDFGAINIDAELIDSRTDDQINLTNGCICCGLAAGFDEAIEALVSREPPPDRIVVEASGVADVVSLAQYGHHPGLTLDGIIVIADAESVRAKARDRYVADTVLRQLRGADLIVLNKTDLVSRERTDSIIDWLSNVAPGVPVVATVDCRVPAPLLLGLELHPRPTDERDDHEAYATWHLESQEPLSEKAVETFVAGLPEEVLRAKGFFNLGGRRQRFQQVGQRWTLEMDASTGPTQIVVIGLEAELDPAVLDRLARELTGCD
ncbi:MAG: GTP-binding protein [Gammaproteobacteria bacterium]